MLLKNEGGFDEIGDPTDDKSGRRLENFVSRFLNRSPLKVTGGTNGYYGTATLVAGTVTVANTSVRTGDKIFLSRQAIGGTAGNLSVGTITNATSFVINSSSGTDTSTVNWMIVRAA